MTIMFWIWSIVAVLIGYLFGSLNFSIIIGKLFYHTDVRQYGSKNAGATNTLRTLGTTPAVCVLVLDTLKAVVAYFATLLITKNQFISYLAATSASIGHNYPVYFGFKGGKGVTVSLGAVFCFNPLAGLCTLLTGVIIIALKRYVSLGSIAAAFSAPFWVLFFCKGSSLRGVAVFLTVILALQIIVRHKANIKRLINHNENKISFHKKGEK